MNATTVGVDLAKNRFELAIRVGEDQPVETRVLALSTGFEMPEIGLRVLADGDIFPEEVHLHESKDHTDNFLTHVYDGKPVVAPVEDAHRTISIAHIGNIGLRLGRTDLKWDPVAERFPNDAAANGMLQREWRKPWAI